jgi:phosphate:Na+ symporter
VGGVLVFFPIFLLLADRIDDLDGSPAIALANIHLVFNLGTSLLFLIFLNPFTRLVEALMGEGKMDFERLAIPAFGSDRDFGQIRGELELNQVALLAFLQENYNLVTLSIESNYRSIQDAAAKRIEYIEFIEREYVSYFSRVVANIKGESQSRQLLALVTQYDYLFQIHDSIDDLFNTRQVMAKHYIELKSDVLLMVRELSSHTLAIFDDIRHALVEGRAPDIAASATRLQSLLTEVSRDLLSLLADPDRRDAGALSNFVTYSRRLNDKLVNFASLRNIPRESED